MFNNFNSQRGFIPLIILAGILAVSLSGVGILIYTKNTKQNLNKQISSESIISPSPSNATSSAKPITNSAKPVTKLSPNPSANPGSTKQTPAPTVTTTTTTTASQSKKNTCAVNVIYGKLSGEASDPLLVTLSASFTGYNNVYITGAQWDFDGNGSWDTDLKQSNSSIEHTYSSGGMYDVKLQVKGSDGTITDVCNKSVSLEGTIDVSVKGILFNDSNCNNSKDSGESGIANIKMTAMSPSGNVYANVYTDANGNYSFTRKIKVNESLGVEMGPADYNVQFVPVTVTLDKNNYSETRNLSHCS